MLARTIDTYKDPIINGNPLWIWLLAVDTKVIHIPFDAFFFLEIALLALKPIFRHCWTTKLCSVFKLRVVWGRWRNHSPIPSLILGADSPQLRDTRISSAVKIRGTYRFFIDKGWLESLILLGFIQGLMLFDAICLNVRSYYFGVLPDLVHSARP